MLARIHILPRLKNLLQTKKKIRYIFSIFKNLIIWTQTFKQTFKKTLKNNKTNKYSRTNVKLFVTFEDYGMTLKTNGRIRMKIIISDPHLQHCNLLSKKHDESSLALKLTQQI